MPAIVQNIVDGADRESSRDDQGRVIIRATRVCFVDVRGSTAESALEDAEAAAAAVLPIYSQYSANDPLGCGVLTRYQSEGVTDSVARVRCYYDTPTPNPGNQPSFWIISDDTQVTMTSTQLNPADWQPLTIKFTAADPKNNLQDVATISFPQAMRTLVLSGPVLLASLDKYRQAVDTVNDAAGFAGDAKAGVWRFSRFRTQVNVGLRNGQPVAAPYAQATVELQKKVGQDWSVAAVLRDTHTGKIVAPRGNDALALKNADYKFGVQSRNAIIRVGCYPTNDFKALFGIG